MKREQRWLAVALLGMSVLCAGCASRSEGGEEAAADEMSNATVVHSEGSQPSRVTLTEDAAAKIDVQTVLAQDERVNGEMRTVIPYAAVLYDENGDTWTYANPEPLVFVRTHITVERITEGKAVLSEGPPAGVAVVTVGAAELFGAESEFEEE